MSVVPGSSTPARNCAASKPGERDLGLALMVMAAAFAGHKPQQMRSSLTMLGVFIGVVA